MINKPSLGHLQSNNKVEKSAPSKNLSDKKFIPKEYKDVAKGMEAQFAQYLISQMRKSIGKEGPTSQSEQFYNSMLDTERAKAMANKNQLGIQDTILNQIYPKRLRNEITFNHHLQKQKMALEQYRQNKIKLETNKSQEISNEQH